MAKVRTAEEILEAMPSGEELFASLAKELNLDKENMHETSGNVNVDKPKTKKVADKGTKGEKQKTPRTSRKKASPVKPDESTNSEELQVSRGEQSESTTDNLTGAGEVICSGEPSGDIPVKPKEAKPSKASGTEVLNRKTVPFAEWNGYRVNYLGRPMDEKGMLLTLPKRYNHLRYEPFREQNGRMILVLFKDKEGKVFEARVFKEGPDGVREQMPTDGIMTNPNRMENRCRMYAHLFQVAYCKKKDMEEVAV